MSQDSGDRFERDRQRLRRIREYEERSEPTYKSRSSRTGSCLLFILLLAIAACIAYYALTHRDRVKSLFQRPVKPAAVDTTPDNGY